MQLATAQATQAAAARREALAWLSRRLRWEHTLDDLRHERDDKESKRAA